MRDGKRKIASETDECAHSQCIRIESAGRGRVAELVVALPLKAQGGIPGKVEFHPGPIRVVLAVGISRAPDTCGKFVVGIPLWLELKSRGSFLS